MERKETKTNSSEKQETDGVPVSATLLDTDQVQFRNEFQNLESGLREAISQIAKVEHSIIKMFTERFDALSDDLKYVNDRLTAFGKQFEKKCDDSEQKPPKKLKIGYK